MLEHFLKVENNFGLSDNETSGRSVIHVVLL